MAKHHPIYIARRAHPFHCLATSAQDAKRTVYDEELLENWLPTELLQNVRDLVHENVLSSKVFHINLACVCP